MNIHVVMLTRAHFDNDTKLVEWVEFRSRKYKFFDGKMDVLLFNVLAGFKSNLHRRESVPTSCYHVKYST